MNKRLAYTIEIYKKSPHNESPLSLQEEKVYLFNLAVAEVRLAARQASYGHLYEFRIHEHEIIDRGPVEKGEWA